MSAVDAISLLISKNDPKDCDEFDISFSIFPGSPKDIKSRNKFADLYDFYDSISYINKYAEIFNFSLNISDKTVYWNEEEGLVE